MKTILVPTDFSANADNALNFAIQLAKHENAKLILLNVFETNYESGAVSYHMIAEERAELENESIKKLQIAAMKPELAGIKSEYITLEGFTQEVILDFADEKEIDLIVMGTKGSTGFSGAIFGSITAKVLENAKCPVMAIPEGAIFNGIKKITYATDYHRSDIAGIKKIIEMAKPFNAQVNILHVSVDPHSPAVDKDAMKKFMDEVNSKMVYDNLSFQVLAGTNIESSLEKYLNTDSTNLLVMSTHHRVLFNKIFGKSITKHMAYHTNIPLVALHYNAETSVTIF